MPNLFEQSVLDAVAHPAADGSSHADVATNSGHRTGDGSDHADVATNSGHRTGDGSDHADVAAATGALAAGKGPGHFPTVEQAVPATVPVVQTFIASAAGTITAAAAYLATKCHGGLGNETLDVDVTIDGTTIFHAGTPTIHFDTGVADGVVVEGVLDAVAFAKGSVIVVSTAHTSDPADTGADLYVSIGYQLT